MGLRAIASTQMHDGVIAMCGDCPGWSRSSRPGCCRGRAGSDPRLHWRSADNLLRAPTRLAVQVIASRTVRLLVANAVVTAGGWVVYRVLLGRRTGPASIGAAAGSVVAAGPIIDMLYRGLARLAARNGGGDRLGGAAVCGPAGACPQGSLDEGRAGGVDGPRRAERHRRRRDHARRDRTAMAVRRAHWRREARMNVRTASTRRCFCVVGPSPSLWKMLFTCFSRRPR